MEISFASERLRNELENDKTLIQQYGTPNQKRVKKTITRIRESRNLHELLPLVNMHHLHGNRDGQYTIKVGKTLRVVIEPDHDPVPLTGGGINTKEVTCIRITEIIHTDSYG